MNDDKFLNNQENFLKQNDDEFSFYSSPITFSYFFSFSISILVLSITFIQKLDFSIHFLQVDLSLNLVLKCANYPHRKIKIFSSLILLLILSSHSFLIISSLSIFLISDKVFFLHSITFILFIISFVEVNIPRSILSNKSCLIEGSLIEICLIKLFNLFILQRSLFILLNYFPY